MVFCVGAYVGVGVTLYLVHTNSHILYHVKKFVAIVFRQFLHSERQLFPVHVSD